jgi:hypothetical protein
MTYDVTGWVEASCVDPAECAGLTSVWMPVLSLDVFSLGGDAISQYLFGLSKSPDGSGLFVARGVPLDCTPVVRRAVSDNAKFVAEHGQGDFGHSHASLDEIRQALSAPTAPDEPESEWHHALASVQFVLDRPFGTVPFSRLVVWANW